MNKVYVIGRLTADPELKTVNGIPVAQFTVAADTRNKGDDGKPLTNFYRCSAWRGLGETFAKYTHKGDRVSVIGDLLLRFYTNTQGQDRAALQVTVTDVEFLSDKRPEQAAQPQETQSYAPAVEDTGDDLPF